MIIKDHILRKHLHKMAIEQLKEEYIAAGYEVELEKKIDGRYKADLLVSKGQEKIIIEVKAGKFTQDKRELIIQLHQILKVSKNNYKLKLVFAEFNRKKNISIENIENIFYNFLSENIPDEIYELCGRNLISEVKDIIIFDTYVTPQKITIKGTGIMVVESIDDPVLSSYSDNIIGKFPFSFSGVIKWSDDSTFFLEDASFKVDNSSYFK